MELTDFSIKEIHKGLKEKSFSALELCRAYLNKIRREDKELSCYLTVTEELALLQAKKIDDLISQGKEISLLSGIPCALKDNILLEDVKCTAGSKILENYIAPYDATVVKKLKKEGVVFLGKTNPDEFAMGSSTENSAFFTTKNPHDKKRVPGGSSGGSAAAVAANLCSFALGSDTGGSIRQPASFCGIAGLKPTYGAVSRYGLIALASSLDQIGPLAKTVEDAKIVFDAIKGKDSLDSTSLTLNVKPYTLNFKSLKIGVPKEYFVKGMDKEVEEIIKKAMKKFEELGVKIKEISLPHSQYALPCYYIIVPSEASANLARYDGIKYGYSEIKNPSAQIQNLLDVYLKSREKGFGDEVRRRIILGTYALSSGYYDAYYLRAQKVKTLIKEDFEKAFEKVDLIFAPTSPTPAFLLGEKTMDPLSMYLSDIFTVPVNLAGLPAISIPCGQVQNFLPSHPKYGGGGLPVGLQIIGKPFGEEEIFQTALFFEKNVQ